MTADKFHDALTLLPSDLIAEADAIRSRRPRVTHLRRYAAMAASLALVIFCGAILTGLLPAYKGATEMAAPEAADMSIKQETAQSPAEAAPLYDEAFGIEETRAASSGNSSTKAESTTEEAAPREEGIPHFGWDITERCSTPFDPNSSINLSSVPQNLVLTTPEELEAYVEDHAAVYDFTELEALLPLYNEKWFQNNDLLITLVHSTSTDFTWTVTGIRDVRGTDEKGWDWFILISATEEPTPDPRKTNYHLLTPVEKGRIDPSSSILNVYDNPNTEGP